MSARASTSSPARRLGRQVAQLPLHDAGVGDLDLACRLGEAEVHDLHLALLRDEHVGRRDVAVDDPHQPAGLGVVHLVRVGEAFAHLEDDVEAVRDRDAAVDPAAPFEQRLQIDAVDVLHDDEVRVLAVADVEHLHDVRVLEGERQPRLVQEHRDELLVLGEGRQDALDGDVLLEPAHRFRDAAEHLCHASGRDSLGDAISTIGHRSPVPAGRYNESAEAAMIARRYVLVRKGAARPDPEAGRRLTPRPEP